MEWPRIVQTERRIHIMGGGQGKKMVRKVRVWKKKWVMKESHIVHSRDGAREPRARGSTKSHTSYEKEGEGPFEGQGQGKGAKGPGLAVKMIKESGRG
jgi:hypothetical protein